MCVRVKGGVLFILGLLFYSFVAHAQTVSEKSIEQRKAEQEIILAQLKQAVADSKVRKPSRQGLLRTQINRNTVTIVLGGGSDTQIRIAQDLLDILNEKDGTGGQDLRVLPVLGEGGSQNALDIMYLYGVDLGITQTDILAHLRGQNWVMYNDIFKRIHYITKLYNAEWHVIGRKEFNNIRELKGKRINISRKDSGTYITSRNIFEMMGIKAHFTTYSNTVALEKLRAGELDAITWMGGAPIDSLRAISPDDGLHIIPVTFFFESYVTFPLKNVLEDLYLPTQLKHQQYPNLIAKGKSIPTVANGIVLAAYNWNLSNNSHRKNKVAKFIRRFFEKFPQFAKDGRHPKWREINLTARIPEWHRADMARKFLASRNSTSSGGNRGRRETYEELMRFIGEQNNIDTENMPDAEKWRIYKEFIRFLKQQ